MEWDAPAIVLSARPFGEGDAVAAVLTGEHGLHRGLARGAQSRTRSATWQAGNVVQARWVGRLSDQLGSLSAEVVHAAAAHVMDEPVMLALLSSACAVAEGALPEREAHPRIFGLLLGLIADLARGPELLADYVRWELALLGALGYGLDLAACAVSGETAGLAFVSPRTGRAVTAAAAGAWRERLLVLPGFLAGANAADARDWRDGLDLTGHFLGRDAFGAHHKPLPPARALLYDRVALLADSEATDGG